MTQPIHPSKPWLLLLMLSAACQDIVDRQAQKLEAKRQQIPSYRVVTIEGCEYLRLETTHGYGILTHKGNCLNPIHCRRDTLAAAGSSAVRP